MTNDVKPRPVGHFFGGMLMAVGGLIAVTAGLCSLAVSVIGLSGAMHNTNELFSLIGDGLPIVLGVGGIPCAIGVGIFFAGRAIYRG